MPGLGHEPVVELAPGSREPVSRPGSDQVAKDRPQSDHHARRDDARAARRAGGRDGALHAHQPGPSPAQGIPEQHADDLGRARDRRLGLPAGGLFLRRVRPARIGADLLGRPGRALRRPHQKRQQPGRAARGRRSVLRPGLFQAAPRWQRLPAGRVSRHASRKPADGAGDRRRRQAGHDLDRNARRRA